MKKLTFNLVSILLICSFWMVESKAQNYNFDNLTLGSSGSLANGWTCSPSLTGQYRWEVGSGFSSGTSTGPSTAFNGSNYMFVVSNDAPGPATTNTATLESPSQDLTSFTNPGFGFWYYGNGASYYDVIVEVNTGGATWTPIDTINLPSHINRNQRWKYKRLDLSSYNTANTKVRFSADSYQTGRGDFAVDNCTFVEMPSEDAGLDGVTASRPYYQIPYQQADSINFIGNLTNYGTSSTSVGATASFTSATGSFSTSSNSTLASGNSSSLTTSAFYPSGTGSYDVEFLLNTAASDTFENNDTLNYQFNVTDSVYSLERGNFSGGIGFTGATGRFGQTFEIYNTDTLTSVDIRLETPQMGDTIRFYLYDVLNNTPSTLIDSSDIFVIPSASPGWYTVEFTCNKELTPGQYFFAVDQRNTNNLGFGFTQEGYVPNICYYRVPNGAWTPFESSGFQVVLGIRPVFGDASSNQFTVDLGPDSTYCPTEPLNLNLDAYVFGGNYSWNNNSTSQSITVDTSGIYAVTVSKCGVSLSDTLEVIELPTADVELGPDTGYCVGEASGFSIPVSLNTPGASYNWANGTQGGTFTIDSAGTYTVYGDLNGCVDTGSISVIEVPYLTEATFGGDTAFCGQNANIGYTLNAQNPGADFNWHDGSSGQTFFVDDSGTYSVTVTQDGFCPDSFTKTLNVIKQPFPDVSLSDTFWCTGSDPIILSPGVGYDDYNWSNGDTTETIEVNSQNTYNVTVSDIYGCSSNASAQVEVRQGININLGQDIDTNTTVTIGASGSFSNIIWSTNETSPTIDVDETGTYWVVVTANNGCTATDTINITIEDETGISDLGKGSLNLYPNPARNAFTLEAINLDGVWNIRLNDMNGREVLTDKRSITGSQKNTFDVSDLTPGMYFLSLQNGQDMRILKIMIE
ncbi:T9SS type A sorting domain-containing protein [Salibacter sp.]|uniref:T9SS type A sorting domain-containing protein n=1 Tax=Salibacter sp. TaxID=2010995 RepID=UPI002870947C|nr:T9SS type A sorting domain-containing protein [Salibacter sp.]MDR9486608.1 T9SS type A sorting domain-containing protein [Salibacter sp.]